MSQTIPAAFPILNEETAPEASLPFLAQAKASFGLIPNVEGVMAQAPALLETYMTGWDVFDQTSLSPQDRQIVYLAANFENNCEYCLPWHTILAEQVGFSKADVEALRLGAPLSDPKQETLRRFARDLVRTQGNIEPSALQLFLDAGYTQQQALEVILGLAIKTMSNYTNAIAQTPLDAAAQGKAWKKPNLRA